MAELLTALFLNSQNEACKAERIFAEEH